MSLFPTKCPWKQYEWIRRIYKETGDCSVVAMALATQRSYQDCHAACALYGRIKRQGFEFPPYRKAFLRLGFELENLKLSARTLLALHEELPQIGVFLIVTPRHYLCQRNGKWLDHTPRNKRRLCNVYQVIKI